MAGSVQHQVAASPYSFSATISTCRNAAGYPAPQVAMNAQGQWRHSSIIVLSSVGLALSLPLLVHGNLSVAVRQGGPRDLSSGGADVTLPDLSKTYVCGGQPIGKDKSTKMVLTAVSGMKFKCATNLTLGPASKSENFPDVYLYKSETSSCDTEKKAATLDSLVTGAKLTKSEPTEPVSSSDPVYTLTYTAAPDKPQTLCYTCNTTAEMNYKLTPAQASTVECTILINVTAKAEGTNGDTDPDVGSTTKPPTSTSGAGGMKASAATAAIGFLLVLSRL
ncbi:sag-related sequence srs11 [Cystoisospora suis]|uniref:Sag-related sequence srs11 n=1 Tax=Cystoisospora suis TaxID=483139 RepID=A0A2C6KFM5_9APIC|nr:sag-related sequence srs11 [Cystoisospora suis]